MYPSSPEEERPSSTVKSDENDLQAHFHRTVKSVFLRLALFNTQNRASHHSPQTIEGRLEMSTSNDVKPVLRALQSTVVRRFPL